MNKEENKRLIIAVTLIIGILGIFMGPGLMRPTAEELINEFVHVYFEASPEEYELLFPNNKYGKNESRVYIEDKLGSLVTKNALDIIIESDAMSSHIKRAYIKKENMTVDKIKVTILKHDYWQDHYNVYGIVKSVKIKDGSIERLGFNGQFTITEEDGRLVIDRVFMLYDQAAYSFDVR